MRVPATSDSLAISRDEFRRAYKEEKKNVERAFLKRTLLVSIVLVIIVVGFVLAVLAADVRIAAAAVFAAFLVLSTTPLTIGDYPFLSPRATRYVVQYLLPASIVVILTVLGLRGIYSVLFPQTTSFAVQVMAILAPPSITVLLGWIVGVVRRVEIAIPKWVTLISSTSLPGSSWAISTPDTMKRLKGVPIVIVNHTRRTLVLSMIWLEYFAPLWAPSDFHRRFILNELVGTGSRTYYQKVVELGETNVVRPGHAFTWVLRWDEARRLYDELRKGGYVGTRQWVFVRVTIYDEYSDRVHSSREIPLSAILSEQNFLEGLPDRTTNLAI